MYIFFVFGVGFYSFGLWPLHIPFWYAGYLVQNKVKSLNVHKVWLCALAAGLLLCEALCRWVLFGYNVLAALIAMLAIWDLLFGYFAKPVCRLLRKLFQALINWITQEEKTEKAD